MREPTPFELERGRQTALDVLGLRPGATAKQLKRAYRKKAMLHHPDKGGDEKQFILANTAYKFLIKRGTSPKSPKKPDVVFQWMDVIARQMAYAEQRRREQECTATQKAQAVEEMRQQAQAGANSFNWQTFRMYFYGDWAKSASNSYTTVSDTTA